MERDNIMEIEREVRYKISKEQKEQIISKTQEIEEEKKTVDLVMGWKGFESLGEYGFICRIRQKNDTVELQIKEKTNDREWKENCLKLDRFKQGYEMLKTLKMQPYLYINRNRQVRKYKSLKIFLDDIELLGNYVEIEYQYSKNEEVEIEEFKELFDIKGKEEKLYGDIFKDKIDKEKKFQKKFTEKLETFICE